MAKIEGDNAYRSAGSVSRLENSAIATLEQIVAPDSTQIEDEHAAELSMRIAESRRALQAAIGFVGNADKFCPTANLSALRSI